MGHHHNTDTQELSMAMQSHPAPGPAWTNDVNAATVYSMLALAVIAGIAVLVLWAYTS
jgi:hypothetical protein